MSVEALFQKHANKKKDEGNIAANKEEDRSDLLKNDEERQKIHDLIDQNQVVVFSKSYCPYCRQAKMTFNSIDNPKLVDNDSYKVVEMDDGNHDGWQSYIANYAKTRALPRAENNNTKSVPQIFINQKYIGGAEDLAEMYVDKSLAEMLGRESL